MEFPVMVTVFDELAQFPVKVNLAKHIKVNDAESIKNVLGYASKEKELNTLLKKYYLVCGEYLQSHFQHVADKYQEIPCLKVCWNLDLAWQYLNGDWLCPDDIDIAKNTTQMAFNLLWWSLNSPLDHFDQYMSSSGGAHQKLYWQGLRARASVLHKLLTTGQIERVIE